MNGITTWDLGILENSYEFLEDLPTGDVRCLELDGKTMNEEWFYKNEKNAKKKFDTLVKKYNLEVKWNWSFATNGWDYSLWMGKIAFSD